jgi:hypothetical protein
MPLTSLSADDAPWWLRGQAGQPIDLPGAQAPTSTGTMVPPDGTGSGGMTWLQYLQSLLGPNAAEAGTLDPAIMAGLNRGGSPIPAALAGGGPQVPPIPPMAQPPGYLNSQSAIAPAPQGSPPGPPGYLGSRSPAPSAPTPPMAAPGPTAGPASPPMGDGRFVQIQRPNLSATGSRGLGGPTMMTALNLAGPGGALGPLAKLLGKRQTTG